MARLKSLFVRHIAIPQDHGSWVFILSPLIIGIFAGGDFTLASFFLVLAAMAVFMIRQPVTVAVKAYSGRRPRTDLPAARFWILVYSAVALAALTGLILQGFLDILYLAVPGAPVFAWHLYLVNRRAERKQAGVEILATGVLALAAPAAYWVGKGVYDPLGWALWLLTWLQSAASIVHAYLRLEQRGLPEVPLRPVRWQMGRRALLYTTFNLILSLITGLAGFLPRFIFVPFLLQWLETLWGITQPAVGVKPTRIGLRQLLVSTLFTILFVLFWR
ncbi:MAG: YwiC-like family protein [Chloroflexota bacterium]